MESVIREWVNNYNQGWDKSWEETERLTHQDCHPVCITPAIYLTSIFFQTVFPFPGSSWITEELELIKAKVILVSTAQGAWSVGWNLRNHWVCFIVRLLFGSRLFFVPERTSTILPEVLIFYLCLFSPKAQKSLLTHTRIVEIELQKLLLRLSNNRMSGNSNGISVSKTELQNGFLLLTYFLQGNVVGEKRELKNLWEMRWREAWDRNQKEMKNAIDTLVSALNFLFCNSFTLFIFHSSFFQISPFFYTWSFVCQVWRTVIHIKLLKQQEMWTKLVFDDDCCY